ncbi:MAG TPA: helix-turn-helix domain-containing protein [bacterium]|nr:MAG: Helix-turn-helix domain protein [Parcubacteria group bacterium ADurb.Bin192]HPN14577.1 helix-turn-helix domain-containing protein [bacterium]
MPEKPVTQTEIPELLTLREAADILKCHPNTLRNWDRSGLLKAVRIGTREDRRYKKEDILKLLNKNYGKNS